MAWDAENCETPVRTGTQSLGSEYVVRRSLIRVMSGVQRAVPAGGMEGGGAKRALQRVDGDADVYVWGSVFGVALPKVKSASVGARGGDMRRGVQTPSRAVRRLALTLDRLHLWPI